MKKLLVLMTFASQFAVAAPTAPKAAKASVARAPAQMSTLTSANEAVGKTNSDTQKIFISTNIVDLSKGNGNVDAHFLMTPAAAFSFNYITTSESEIVKEVNPDGKIKVDRRAYGIGGALFLKPFSNTTTFMINPTIQFGQKSDAINVTNQTGLRVKLSAIHKPAPNFALEAGIRADNLEDTFKGEAVVGVGFIL